MSTDPYPPQPDPGPDGTPPPASSYPPPPGPGASGGDRFFDSIRRTGLARSNDRWVGGVAGGVAERLGWDPLLVRGLLFLSFFVTGIGLVIYAIGWALLPERSDGRIHLQQALRGDFDVALLGAIASLLVGFGWSGGVGSWWGHGNWGWVVSLFWFAVWVTAIFLLFRFLRDRRRNRGAYPPRPGQAPYAAPYPTQPGTTGYPGATGTTSAADAGTPGAAAFTAPVPPPDDPRAREAWARAEADRARAQARSQAAGARAQAAQERAFAARETAQARAAAAQARAQEAQARVQARAAERASRPITKSAGAGTVGVVLGLLLIAGALLLAQDRTGLSLPWPFDGGYDAALAWLGLALVIVGGGIVVSGIRGRSSGWLGFFAIVGLVVALPWSVSASADGFPHARISGVTSEWRGVGDRGIDVSEGTVVPRSLAEAERGFRVQFGDPTIDLSGIDLSQATTANPVEVPISLTAGNLTVVVPRDSAVEADVRLLAGQVFWQVDPQPQTLNRIGSATAHLSSDEAGATGATLRLFLSAGAGNITVEEG